MTELQTAFVIAFTSDSAAIGNPTAAAKLAGYAEGSARDLGRRLVALPHIQDAIRAANQQQISGSLATKSIALLGRVIEDENAPMKVRVDAARAILDRGGYPALPATAKRPDDKTLSEMTSDELRDVMRQARAEMDKSRVIDQPSVADPDAPPPAQPILDAAVALHPTNDGAKEIAP